MWGCRRRRRKREGRRKRVRMTESERLAGTLGKVKVRPGKGRPPAGRQAGRQVKRPGKARQVQQPEQRSG